jgi:hypothetical protein
MGERKMWDSAQGGYGELVIDAVEQLRGYQFCDSVGGLP